MINEKEIKQRFPLEMRERMEYAGLRPYHIPYYCHCKPSAVDNYLQGSCLPNLWSLVLMAEHLDCTVNELFGIDIIDIEMEYERHLASKMFSNSFDFAYCVADRMVYLINEKFDSLDEFSRHSTITKDAINRWTGSHPKLPRTSDLIRVCNALNCTPSDLLGY